MPTSKPDRTPLAGRVGPVPLVAMALALTACSPPTVTPPPPPMGAGSGAEGGVVAPGDAPGARAGQHEGGGRPRVVATTALVGEVVRRVAGDAVELEVLLPPEADPHAYEPSPADAAALEEADLVVTSGFGLEETLLPLLEGLDAADDGPRVASASAAVPPRVEGEGAAPDPHVWLDPTNVALWGGTVAEQLGVLMPEQALAFVQNASAVAQEMGALDTWIGEQVGRLPPERRLLVTDHEALGWFADRYGFEVVGTVVPGSSTTSAASAGDLAALVDAMTARGVPAVFVTERAEADLAAQVAREAGAALVPLLVGTLTGSDGPAPTYEAMMRHDVAAIVTALGSGAGAGTEGGAGDGD